VRSDVASSRHSQPDGFVIQPRNLLEVLWREWLVESTPSLTGFCRKLRLNQRPQVVEGIAVIVSQYALMRTPLFLIVRTPTAKTPSFSKRSCHEVEIDDYVAKMARPDARSRGPAEDLQRHAAKISNTACDVEQHGELVERVIDHDAERIAVRDAIR